MHIPAEPSSSEEEEETQRKQQECRQLTFAAAVEPSAVGADGVELVEVASNN